jgi:DNA mismatch endonuclease (patch repair protein)
VRETCADVHPEEAAVDVLPCVFVVYVARARKVLPEHAHACYLPERRILFLLTGRAAVHRRKPQFPKAVEHRPLPEYNRWPEIGVPPGSGYMDKLTPYARSRNMSRIRSRDTAPELLVRRFLHREGLRFRLHGRHLPGKPDLVFAGRKTCVFVHGCFWHGCPNCIDGTRKVKSNTGYWNGKVAGNRARDARHVAQLRDDGWRVFVVWECETKNPGRLGELSAEIKALSEKKRPRNVRGLDKNTSKFSPH